MLALQIVQPGESQVIEQPTPEPGPGEVLLRINRVGFCGTDLSTFRGVNPLVSYPRIPGHEIAGEIIELGAGVTDWSVGEEVLVFPYNACGACSACIAGRPNCCRFNQTLGVQRDGAMAQFFATPASKLLRAEGLSSEERALVEPLTVGFHAVARAGVSSADTVAVFGSGMIGLGIVAAAAARGARVIAVDIDDGKLDSARRAGASETINSHRDSLGERLRDLTGGHGPSVAVEAVGRPETFVAAVEQVCFAGRVVFVGYSKPPVEFDSKLFVLKELDIRGSRNALRSDFAAVIEFLRAGRFPSEEVVSHRVPLKAAGDTLRSWDQAPHGFSKIQVEFP
ncbi:MAG TPA: zinc-binding alcohol dehydrogenase family protein [Lacipirellula sp.]